MAFRGQSTKYKCLENFALYGIQEKVDMNVPFMLSQYCGDWRAVEPQDTWPLMFIGCFPKQNPFETERERELRLNQEVRAPLKEYLGGLVKQQLQAQGKPLPKKTC